MNEEDAETAIKMLSEMGAPFKTCLEAAAQDLGYMVQNIPVEVLGLAFVNHQRFLIGQEMIRLKGWKPKYQEGQE